MNGQTIRTFMSANSADGFFSFFDEFLKGKTSFIIKGGPGTGKSGFMKKIASAAVSKGNFTEYVYCSSDPDSLDGVYIYGIETVFTDGTPPHVMEPKYPGVMGGIVDVGQFLDSSILNSFKDDIVSLNSGISSRYSRAYRYLKAARCAASELEDIAQRYLNKESLLKYFKTAVGKIFGNRKGSGGKRFVRFLSGITPKGFITFKDTVYTLCSDVWVIKDKYGIGSFIFEILCDEAVERGFDVYEFHSPLDPSKITHLAVPELDIAIVTSNKMTQFDSRNTRSVDMSRFISEDIEFEYKYAVSASKIMKICLDEACEALSAAKALHDDLEDIYISAMDFDSLDMYIEKYCNMI